MMSKCKYCPTCNRTMVGFVCTSGTTAPDSAAYYCEYCAADWYNRQLIEMKGAEIDTAKATFREKEREI